MGLGIDVGLLEVPSPHLQVWICLVNSQSSYTSHHQMNKELEQRNLETCFYLQENLCLAWTRAKILRNVNMAKKSKGEAK